MRVVDAAALRAEAIDLAPWLLNKLLVVDDAAVRIVEVEAYGGVDDPASHAHRGSTPRNREMFAAGGRLYTYLIYGLHVCANVVSGAAGEGQAVLIRAGEPVCGQDAMSVRRPVARARELTSGPAKLTQALGIGLGDGGVVLSDAASRIRLMTDDLPPPRRPGRGPRVGISTAVDRPWRFWVPESAWVSRR